MLTVYTYEKCSTCRDALKWLREHGIAHVVKPIRETPPSRDEIRAALKAHGGDPRKLFNTSGVDYREQGLKAVLPSLTEDGAVALLTGNGNLVKRPFVIGNGVCLTGFRPQEWSQVLTK